MVACFEIIVSDNYSDWSWHYNIYSDCGRQMPWSIC